MDDPSHGAACSSAWPRRACAWRSTTSARTSPHSPACATSGRRCSRSTARSCAGSPGPPRGGDRHRDRAAGQALELSASPRASNTPSQLDFLATHGCGLARASTWRGRCRPRWSPRYFNPRWRASSRRPCRRASLGSARAGAGPVRSRPNIAPNVCRFATRKTQNALIIMWTSIGVGVAPEDALGAPALEDPADELDRGHVEVGESLRLA